MASTKISFTPSGAGNLNKWTISLWLKRAKVGVEQVIASCYENSNYQTQIKFESDDQLYFNDENNGNTNGRIVSNAKYRDTHSWYHMVFIWDKDNSTSGDKIRMYVNGERITSFSDTGNAPSTSSTWNVNGQAMQFGAKVTSDYFDGCMSHIHFCDGYAYEPTEFGETDSTTGEWKIKTSPSVSYGTNGYFWLKDDVATTDHSPNSNTFTASGTLTKTEDCPSNVFATINPLYRHSATYANGNLKSTNASNKFGGVASIGVSSGKYYAEFKMLSAGGENGAVGIYGNPQNGSYDNQGVGKDGNSYSYRSDDGKKVIGNTDTSYGDAFTTNAIISIALDLDNNKLYFAKDGVWQNSGVPTSGSTGTGAIDISLTPPEGYWFIAANCNSATNTAVWEHNYGNGYFGTTQISTEGTNASGNGKFEYDVPTGYTALCTKGLNA